MADAPRPDEAQPPRAKKQAVLLIHGMGEQRPMSTLWRFVDLVWLSAPGAAKRSVYSEPDEVSGVFELRRLSTTANADGRRTDFFEFYWAHLMSGNKLGDVLSWLTRLALRPRAFMPVTLQGPWRALHALSAAIMLAVLIGAGGVFAGAVGNWGLVAIIAAAMAAMMVVFVVANQLFLTPVLGDAARYLRPSPKNVPCRQAIRQHGLQVLQALHKSGKYDRIILVGHSLGGVIAYEIALLAWGARNRAMDRPGPVQDALLESEAAARALLECPDQPPDQSTQDAWRAAQARLFEALRAETGPDGAPLWLVSDLVTLGCPIAHAQALLAESPDAFERAMDRREMAACPPRFEIFQNGARRFSYCRRPGVDSDPEAGPRAPHISALFAATGWTNIYFPMLNPFRGDFIGGAAAPIFGPGVRDLAVRAPEPGRRVPHMDYFSTQAAAAPEGEGGNDELSDHRAALRAALALEGERAFKPASEV